MRFLEQLFRRIFTRKRNVSAQTYTGSVCGHVTKLKGEMSGGGIMEMPLGKDSQPEYCIDCIDKMTIKCAWCGKLIYIGDPITLYTPTDAYKLPDYPVTHYTEHGSKALVGCLRWKCCDTGGDRSGFWVPPGKVERVMSPIEMAFASGNAVIVSDLGDPSNIGKVIPPADHSKN